jgi:long-subunit acyl-CoA synthetase (AMP-forming)
MDEFLTAHQALINWAEKMPEQIFLSQPVDGELRTYTWQQADNEARCMASALRGMGLQPGDKVAILAKNSAEWFLADFAIAMAGMISVPIYPTAGIETTAYIIGHSEANAVFIGKLDDPKVAAEAIPASMPTIAFPYQVDGCQYRWQDLVTEHGPIELPHEPRPDDVMTILYTSGSTGQPKGVVISFKAYWYASTVSAATMGLRADDRLFSYLPLAHITERTCTAGPGIYVGASCAFVESLETFNSDLQRARPTVFLSVPRLWVKFQSAVHAKIPPTKLKTLLTIPILGRIVARKIREELGFGSCRRYGSGSAPISPSTLKWYEKLGIDISEGWGMSETSGLSSANSPFDRRRIGSIGGPIDGTEMKLSAQGEILLRSPGLFSGYFKRDDLTREVFTDDGFFRTGDKAEWNAETQAYRITGRVKDIFKSAKGKYVVPVPIESRFSANPLLEQICVMGSGLPAPVAMVVLAEAAQQLPKDNVEERLRATLVDVNAHLESHECVAHTIIVKDDWTTENGLLTPTLKLKRNVLEEKYKALIGRQHTSEVVWEAGQ